MREEFTVDRANQFIADKKDSVITQFKPELHFSAPVGWINDPNGFVYFQGEYHLFYQYYPYGSFWGSMHWGHAKTSDFVTWVQLPVALAPDQPYDRDGCFSGSAIVKDDMLWLMYTGNVKNADGSVSQIQNMAYSKDGIHFEKLASNPVATGDILPSDFIKSDFRDPKLFERNGRYYAVVAAKHQDNVGSVILLCSDDLQDWKFESVFLKGTPDQGNMWECPDYFEVNGQSYLVVSPMRYPKNGEDFCNLNSTILISGDVIWEDKVFHPETVKELDHGQDFYAPQSLKDNQNRRLLIAWMQTWHRTVAPHELGHGWAGNMTLPRVLIKEGNHVRQALPKEVLEKMPKLTLGSQVTHAGYFEVKISRDATFRLGDEEDYITFGYQDGAAFIDRSHQKFIIQGDENWSVNRRSVSVSANELQVFIDKNSIEVFVNRGQETLTATHYLQGEKWLTQLM